MFFARDRFGEKPLYYYQSSGLFAFASEATALLAHARIEAASDQTALQKYFAYGYVPAPGAFYQNCRKLPGGWRMQFDLATRKLETSPYWKFRLRPDRSFEVRPEGEIVEELRALLNQAVRRRLIADVPLGLFLSGGIDSSAVLVGAATAMPADHIDTFSIGFRDPTFDESAYARRMAAQYGTIHHERILDLEEAKKLAPVVLSRMDEPLADGSVLPTHLLARFTREHVTVALSGDGGDELFAGYDPFAALGPAALYSALVPKPVHRFARKLVDRLPVSSRNMSLDFRLRRALAGLSYPQALWNAVWMGPLEPRDFPDLFSSPLSTEELYGEVLELWQDGEDAGLNLIERTLEFYTRFYLQEDVLMKVDRAAMMCSLETRAVFLDNDLVAFAERLPTRFKLCRGQRKVLLKKALAGALPPEILNRPKKGFGIPLAAWLKQGVQFPTARLPAQINTALIAEHMQAHKSGAADHRMFLWASLGLAHNVSATARSVANA